MYFFFNFWFEIGDRKSLNSNGKERKCHLITIPTIKMINFDVYEFHLIKKISIRWFFIFKLSENVDLTLESFWVSG
jgi:hypothetical protein